MVRRKKRKKSIRKLAAAAGAGAVFGVVVPVLGQHIIALIDGLRHGCSDRKQDEGDRSQR